MLFYVQDDVEISGLATVGPGFAEAAKTDAGAIFDTSGNFRFNGSLAKDSSLPFALEAGVGDDLSQTLAGGTSTGNAEESLLVTDLAVAAAGAAGNGRFAGSSARTAAGFTSFVAANVDRGLRAEYSFFKFEGDIFAEIGAPLHTVASLAAASAAEEIEAEEVAKNVVEIVEDGLVESSGIGAYAGVAEAVIGGALVAVGQDRISLRGFLEFLFRPGVIGIAVGMVLHGELAVGALDFLFTGAALHSENFVIIAFCVGSQTAILK
jgi:hypothetical protein